MKEILLPQIQGHLNGNKRIFKSFYNKNANLDEICKLIKK